MTAVTFASVIGSAALLACGSACVGAAPTGGRTDATAAPSDAAPETACVHADRWIAEDDYSHPQAYTTQFTAVKRSPDGSLYRVGMARLSADNSLGFRWLVRKRTDQEWTLVDDFQFSAGGANIAFNLDINPAGSVLVTGQSFQTDQDIWLARRSDDGGTTWAESSGYRFATGVVGHGLRLARDGARDVYETGAYGPGDGVRGLTRKSTDDGVTWTPVDDFQVTGGAATEITIYRGLHVTADRRLFVVGYSMNAAGKYVPLIRTSPPGGTSWSTATAPAISGAAEAWDVTSDESGTLILIATVGEAGERRWEIYRSRDGAGTWQLADSYQLAAGHGSEARDIEITRRGEIFVSGFARDEQESLHWLIRRSSDGGETWATSDEFRLSDGRDVIENYQGYESIYLSLDDSDQTLYASGVGILRKLVCE